jgi:hypothetical protein
LSGHVSLAVLAAICQVTDANGRTGLTPRP